MAAANPGLIASHPQLDIPFYLFFFSWSNPLNGALCFIKLPIMRCAPGMFSLVLELVIPTSISQVWEGFIHLALMGQCIRDYIAHSNLIM